jgi:beta-phosphoglucomutase
MKGCLFDLDGVLVDTAVYHYKAWKRLADKLGFDFTEEQNERLKGVSRMDSLNILLEIGNLTLDDNQKLENATLKNQWYVEYISKMGPEEILPGVENFLASLKEKNYLISLGSASKNAPLILERTGLKKYFDATVDGSDVTNAKPDPEIFLTGAQRLGLKPDECVVFEDSVAGIEAANRGGMFSLGVGSADVLTEADAVIPGFENYTVNDFETTVAIA